MSYETVTVVGTLLAVVFAVVISNWAMLRGFRSEIRGDISRLRTELKADIAAGAKETALLRTELKAEIAAGAKQTALLRTELKGDISELRTELKGDISELRTELVGLNQRIDATNSRIDRLTDSLMSLRSVSAGA